MKIKKLIYYGKCKNCGVEKIELTGFLGSTFINLKDGAGTAIINYNSNMIYHNCSKNSIGVFEITRIELV